MFTYLCYSLTLDPYIWDVTTDRIEQAIETFFIFVNCIISKKKMNRIEKNREASVNCFIYIYIRKQAVSK